VPDLSGAANQRSQTAIKTVIEPHAVSPLQLRDDDQDKFARAHTNFSWNVFRRLAESHAEENFVYSPVALQFALGLTVIGARGGGENRLARVTAPGVRPERIYEVMQSWQEQLLRSMESSAQPGTQSVGMLRFGNSLWLDDSVQPNSAFVDKAKQFFGFGVYRVPLRAATNETLSTINQWASDRTEGRLGQMVKSLSATEQAVLLSATYLKTKFISPFGGVEPEPFSSASGAKGSVDMMHNVLRARYLQSRSYVALELDLVYGATSLVSVMPLIGSPQALARTLTAQKWAQLLSSLEHSKATIDLHWPKLNLRNRYDKISGILDVASPLPQPFVAQNSEITSFVHEAALVISQDGVEVPSAAGTAAQSAATPEGKDAEIKVVRFDRPFVFAIIHRLTGSTLFAGQVVAP
jgi:serpin B